MSRILWLSDFRLDLFDGGDGGAATAATGTDGSGDTQGAVPGSTRRGKSGDTPVVLYGKQADKAVQAAADAGKTASDAAKSEKSVAQPTSNTLDDRRRAFSELIKGEYKDMFAEETQRIIDRRFKQTKTLEDTVAKQQPLMDMLMTRYKISDGDTEKLMAALENDDAYWSEAADEAGMTVEQYKKFQKLQRENEALRREEQARMGQQRAQEQLDKWMEDAQEVKVKYPAFDLKAEVSNPQFLAMLKAGLPMEHAYKVIHMDEILSDAMRNSAITTEKRVVDNVRAKGQRPQENGTAAQSAFIVKDDVSKLTKKDRADIAQRALRGEVISF